MVLAAAVTEEMAEMEEITVILKKRIAAAEAAAVTEEMAEMEKSMAAAEAAAVTEEMAEMEEPTEAAEAAVSFQTVELDSTDGLQNPAEFPPVAEGAALAHRAAMAEVAFASYFTKRW